MSSSSPRMSTPRSQRPSAARVPATSSSKRPIARLQSIGGFDPTGDSLLATVEPTPGSWDPLAVVSSPWSAAESAPESAGTPHPSALRELADRAGVQVNVLRHTLEQAIRLERAIGGKTSELAQRLDQAGRFEREMDRRLEAAGRSVGVLNHAAAAIASLEKLITEMRGTQANIEEGFRRELAAQQARAEQHLAEQEQRWSQRLAESEGRIAELLDQHAETAAAKLQEHSEAFAARLTEISDQSVRALHTAQSHAAAAESEALRVREMLVRGVQGEAEKLASALERQAAQVQARVAVALDEAADRVADMERTAARVGVTANERLEKVCDRAASVLGYDPRRIGIGIEPPNPPATDSLADLTQRAEAALADAHDHLLRISIASERAGEVEVKLREAIAQAGEVKTGQQVIDEATAAEQRLVSLRDDLESMATSVRYNLSQAQQAEAILAKTIDRARDKAHTLDHAMDQVTEQAGSMVQVARDVAGLVMRAEQAREALTTVVETAAAPEPGAAKPIRAAQAQGRRAPFGAPKQVRGDDNAAAA